MFPDEIYKIYAEGKQQPVPVIVGSNADEGTSLPATVPQRRRRIQVRDAAQVWRPGRAFLQIYPVAKSKRRAQSRYLHSLRDEWFTWEMRTWARLTQKARRQGLRLLLLAGAAATRRRKYGAYHAAEIVYAFDNLRLLPWKSEPADQALADAMSGAWVRFAASGDPNGGTLATWTAYDPQREMYLELGDPIHPGSASTACPVRLLR